MLLWLAPVPVTQAKVCFYRVVQGLGPEGAAECGSALPWVVNA